MTSPSPVSYSSPSNLSRKPGFRRVYQACENCREKKQKCVMGDPASPRPPCQTCRRASLPCVLPKTKRKGRPPKRPRVEPVNDASSVAPIAQSRGESQLSATVNETDGASQSAWQTFMTSFEPVVGTDDDASTKTPQSGSINSQKQPTTYDQQIASRTFATFPLRNTSDAIRLLDQAEVKDDDGAQNPLGKQRAPASDREDAFGAGSSGPSFFLLQEGYINDANIIELFHFYLGSVHAIMPLIPYNRMPVTSEDIVAMAGREPHFMAAILVVTASLKGYQELHKSLWQRVRSLFADVAIIGVNASTEVIEGLILLSEYPPNLGHGTGLGFENRMCWMAVGTAVRLGYLLGLEQLGLQAEDVDEKLVQDRDRGKVVWSYCYCLDRQISIRVGKTFWHRSPGMTYQHLHLDPAEDFPEMREIPGVQDDYAAYLQCLLHMTQIFSNAHDLLYPSKSRSAALVKAEHYYKHIDEFTETLSAFRNRWQKRPWQTYPINECVWISFHHLRLYIYSFSLQAYMQRTSSDTSRPADYFPTGLMGSSDARFIVEAINAAADVLRLAIGRLQPSGALSCLPLRFFLFFSHAGVFLLKAAVIVPLPPSQKRAILRLIQALTGCISKASSDPTHPGVRYSSALDRLLGRIYRVRDLQTPGLARSLSPRGDNGASADWNQSTVIDPPPDGIDLPALLGGKESSFVAERPFQDLVTDMDALFGLAPDEPLIDLQPTTENNDQSRLLPSFDPFTSLFSNDDKDIWEPLT